MMNYYHVWCNLKESSKDLEFCAAVNAYLGHLKTQGHIQSFNVTRRKFGFGPQELGEFLVTIVVQNVAQLDDAFRLVATRSGEVERLHAAVFTAVKDLKTALYRDFPDNERRSSN